MTIAVPGDYIYLDYAATAPLCEESVAAMEPYLRPGTANLPLGMNANSLHAPGRAAFEAMENARRSIASALGASRPSEIIFTSGATESCNAAVLGIARAANAERNKRNKRNRQNRQNDAANQGIEANPRVIVSAIEHDAVAKPAAQLKAKGFEVIAVKPDRQGRLTPDMLNEVLDERTVLVSVQMANSEIGTIQPIADLARAAHEKGALFHADATQALGKVPFDLQELGIDAASFSAHKIGGPKGVGALYLKARTPFEPLIVGGGQEEGKRSTTQNVCGIVGFAAALVAAVSILDDEAQRLCGLRDRLYKELAQFPVVTPTVTVPEESRDFLPNIVNVLVSGYESETLVLRLDMMGFGVSGGSACSSHSLEPSHVLRAIGVTGDDIYGALRVSIGRYTTEGDITAFIEAFKSCVS